MPWLRLTIITPAEVVDSVVDLLERFSAEAISVSAASDEPLFAEGVTTSEQVGYWQQNKISALLHPDLELDIVIASLRNQLGEKNLLQHHIEVVQDKNWVGEFEATHGALLIRETLCICPSWDTPPAPDLITIQLDPGLAFGTGTHPTTQLCLQWLVDNKDMLNNSSFIDYGCGSGVLALAAAKLGVQHAIAVDIDPQAIIASRANVKKNALENHIVISDVVDFDGQSVDVLMANILCGPLLELAAKFANYVVTDGQIVLSGLLATQVEACSECYSQWFEMHEPVFIDEWAMLSGVRKQV